MSELKPGWKKVKFGDVVQLSKTKSKDPEADGLTRYVGLEHLVPEDLRIRSWGDVADGTTFTSWFKPGQVLFGKRRAYQRKVAVADFEGVCSGDIYIFESKNPLILLPELLPFICQTDAFFDYAIGTSAGSLSPRTNWKSLAKYEFALPPLEEQRRIAHIMGHFEAARNANSELLASQACVKEAALKEIIRNHVDSFGTQNAQHLLKRLTVGIVVKPAAWYTDKENGVPALRSLNVLPGRVVEDDLIYISVEGHEKHHKSALNAGDVVVVRSGRPGDAAVIPEDTGQLNAIDLIVSTPVDGLSPHYLVAVLNSTFGRIQLAAGTAGTAQLHFNVKLFKTLKIPLAPSEEQVRLCNVISEIDHCEKITSDKLAQLIKAKKSVMREVFQ